MSIIKEYIVEPSREIPIAAEYDVLVVGGGIAGVSAALAAARQGNQVCIIEKQSGMGGLATLGLVDIYLPLCDGMGNQVAGGIAEELLLLSIENTPHALPECWKKDSDLSQRVQNRYMAEFNPASFILSIEKKLLENHIDIWYDTRFCHVHCKDKTIDSIFVENKSGRLAIKSKVVIDATGDADVCFMAGENTVSCDQNRRSCWFYGLTENKVIRYMTSDPIYGKIPTGSRVYSGDNGKDVSAQILDGHRMVEDFIATTKIQSNQHIKPLILPSIADLRTSRRLQGTTVFSEEHFGESFEDCIGKIADWRKPSPAYEIPFSALYGLKINNLLTAGRCISATGDAWEITRVIPTCAVTGQAAGVAASLMISSQTKCIQELNVKKLQGVLVESGCKL